MKHEIIDCVGISAYAKHKVRAWAKLFFRDKKCRVKNWVRVVIATWGMLRYQQVRCTREEREGGLGEHYSLKSKA